MHTGCTVPGHPDSSPLLISALVHVVQVPPGGPGDCLPSGTTNPGINSSKDFTPYPCTADAQWHRILWFFGACTRTYTAIIVYMNLVSCRYRCGRLVALQLAFYLWQDGDFISRRF
ncbi:hypothetical protein K466DRAFT_97790 [Polyporus arcularius HHB13444]|uniref:Uncharacterized protein n=1 Tax=Polyporus arcularius HHB13444 TaxID=1314778 RepID=A0A5C3PDG2_9APHY|nr:hypothetical protein K466DRAFT_97790 [Polyporus arcularius HHB13444]